MKFDQKKLYNDITKQNFSQSYTKFLKLGNPKNEKCGFNKDHVYLLLKLKNALKKKKLTITVNYSSLNYRFLCALKTMYLIDGFLLKKMAHSSVMIVMLKYD